MSNPSLGIETSVLLKKESTPGTRVALTTGAVHCDLVDESLDYIPVLTDLPVLTGNRQRRATMDFVSHNDGGGSFTIRPRSAQMDQLLELILGKANVGAWEPITDDATDLPQFTVEVNKAGQDKVALVGCKVNTARFTSEENSPLLCELAVIAMSGERNSAQTSFSPTQLDDENPYMHSGLAFSGSSSWLDDGTASGNPEVRSFEFTINNNLEIDVFTNATTRRIIPVGLFTLEGSFVIPYNATTKGFWTDMIAAAKVKFTSTWTDNSGSTLAIDFVVKLDGELPKISGPENQWLTINFHGVADTTDTVAISAENTE